MNFIRIISHLWHWESTGVRSEMVIESKILEESKENEEKLKMY